MHIQNIYNYKIYEVYKIHVVGNEIQFVVYDEKHGFMLVSADAYQPYTEMFG